MKLSPEDIAFPRSVNDLEKYADNLKIYAKGTPIHVKGALLYNHFIEKMSLGKKYQTIRNAEKIKFLYIMEPNPNSISVLSFPGVLPKEFVDINPFIDYNTQFEKSFVDPLNSILETVGWTAEPKSSLKAFFA